MTDLSQTADQETSKEELETPIPEDAVAQPANTERAQRKEQKRIDARSWFPRENVAVIMTDLLVGSPSITKLWNATFARTQIAMHMLQEVVPSTGEMESARGVEKLIDERLTSMESELENEYARLMTLAAGEGIASIPPKNYPNMGAVTLPVFTPGAGRFLRLLAKIDNLFWLTDYLWLQGIIKLDHKWQIVNRWKRLIWDFVKFTTQTWIRNRASLRRKQDETAARRNSKPAKVAPAETAQAA